MRHDAPGLFFPPELFRSGQSIRAWSNLPRSAAALLQRFLDGEFGIQHGVGPRERYASPRSGCVEKDDPFPAAWIYRLNDFKLDGFVFHGHSSTRRHRNFHNLPCNSCLHVEPLSIDIQYHRRCSSDGKGYDCKSKSDEFQPASIRHFVYPNKYLSDAAIPAAIRLAIAASVHSGRALRVARWVRVLPKFVIQPHQLSAPRRAISQAVACQFIGIALTSLPFPT